MKLPKDYMHKEQLEQRLGQMSQLAGIKEYSFENGPSEGIHAADIYNGSGLQFTILKSRGLDIADIFYNGIPLSWKSTAGILAPTQGYHYGKDFLHAFHGGLFITCGLTHAGGPCMDGDESLGLHGRYTHQRAHTSAVKQDWVDGKYILEVCGEVRDARLFGPNFILRRRISTELGIPEILVEDMITNYNDTASPLSLLYHINFGYPLLNEGAEFQYDADRYTRWEGSVRDPEEKDFRLVQPPTPRHAGEKEDFVYIHPRADAGGLVRAGLINEELGLGLEINYPIQHLPRLGFWMHYGGYGSYAAALEVMNCGVEGRSVDREHGWLEMLSPGETKSYWLKFKVLEGTEALAALKNHCS